MTLRRAAIILLVIGGVGLLLWSYRTELFVQQAARFSAPLRPPPEFLPPECRPMDEAELARSRLAIEVLRTFRPEDVKSPLYDAAIRHFTWIPVGRTDEGRYVCPPTELYDELAQAAIGAGLFSPRGSPFEAIDLARKLGPRDPAILAGVARIAFAPDRISTTGNPDLRVTAKVVLAEFCRGPSELSARARREMSMATQHGRAAARIATACGEAGAVEQVSSWMQEVLDATGGGVISEHTGGVLYELAFALEAAGQAAAAHAAPVVAMLGRRVRTPAPPFGIIDGYPLGMCAIARTIGGAAAEAAATKAFCQPRRRRVVLD